MAVHRGEIVESTAKQSGIAMKFVAQKLKITRNTLYSRFRDPNLSYEFIKKLGSIIHYDFSITFPEMKGEESIDDVASLYLEKNTADLLNLERKHRVLLERYHKLLVLLTALANSNDLSNIKKEILNFMEGNDL